MSIKYKVVEEWSAPTFYDYATNEVAYDEAQESVQNLWVVSYDEDGILEWLERFNVGEDEEALARAEELNKEPCDE